MRDTARAPQPPTDPPTGHRISLHGLAQMTKKANFGPNLGKKSKFLLDDVSECWLQVAKLQISHCYVKVYEKNIIESI